MTNITPLWDKRAWEGFGSFFRAGMQKWLLDQSSNSLLAAEGNCIGKRSS
jgi:hypothetical protein